MQKLGRIRPVYSGEWNSGKAYTALEMVRTPDGGLSYIAQKDVPAGMPLTNGEYWAVVLDVSEVLEAAENAADRINNVMDVKANALAASATGNPVQIYPDEHSIIKPVLTLLPVQSGSGDPSPENVRPIAGRTGAELVRCGKNLLNLSGAYVNGWNITNIPNRLKPNRQYVFSVVKSGSISFAVYAMTGLSAGESEKTVKLTESYYNEGGSATFVTPDDICDYNYIVLAGSASGIAGVFPEVKFQLELGSTTTPFEPYQGDTFALNFGQTVYGGTLDWNKGEMVVDTGYMALDGTEGWNKAGSAPNTFYYDFYSAGGTPGNPGLFAGICSHYKTATTTAYGSETAYYPLNYTNVILRNMFTDAQHADLANWKAYLAAQKAAGTPVQIAYKLLTPITIQLTPQQITALAGMNTVYSDADGMVVDYNRDLANAYEELRNAIIAMGGNV